MALSKERSGFRAAGSPAAQDTQAAVKIPWIVAFLTETRWDDGSERQPGSILVTAEEGLWKAWVNDRAGLRSAWLSCPDLLGLLGRVEAGLSDGTLSWRSEKSVRRGR